MTGFALNVVAAVLVWQSEFFLGGVVFIVGSICDTLDGGYSRMSGKGTPFGAFLDSTLDRIEEGIVLTAVAATFAERATSSRSRRSSSPCWRRWWSPTPARGPRRWASSARSASPTALVRVVILSAGLVFADLGALEPAVYVLAGLTSVTVLQRIFHVRQRAHAGRRRCNSGPRGVLDPANLEKGTNPT